MKSKGDAGDAPLEFIQEVGVPGALHTDDAKELTSGHWEQVRKDHGIKQTLVEPYSPF
jgi:transposase InsO family protein